MEMLEYPREQIEKLKKEWKEAEHQSYIIGSYINEITGTEEEIKQAQDKLKESENYSKSLLYQIEELKEPFNDKAREVELEIENKMNEIELEIENNINKVKGKSYKELLLNFIGLNRTNLYIIVIIVIGIIFLLVLCCSIAICMHKVGYSRIKTVLNI